MLGSHQFKTKGDEIFYLRSYIKTLEKDKSHTGIKGHSPGYKARVTLEFINDYLKEYNKSIEEIHNHINSNQIIMVKFQKYLGDITSQDRNFY